MTIIDTQTVDASFAERSAIYLADRGCTPSQIREALIDELDLAPREAESIVERIAA